MITLQYLNGGVAWLPLPDYPSCGPEVVLSCSDGTITAPAAVLAALSPLFQSLFRGSFCSCDQPYSLIFVEESSKVVYALIQLLATGSADVCTSYYDDVLSLAASFSIELISPLAPDPTAIVGDGHFIPAVSSSPLVVPEDSVITLPEVTDYSHCTVDINFDGVFLGFDENLNLSSDVVRFPYADPSLFSSSPPYHSHSPADHSPFLSPSPRSSPSAPAPVLQKVARLPKSRRPAQCAICFKMYADIFSLRRHEAAIHDGYGERHQCDVCGFSVAGDRSHLSQHRARHFRA